MTQTPAREYSPNAFAVRVDDGSALRGWSPSDLVVVDPADQVQADDYALEVDAAGRTAVVEASAHERHCQIGPVVEVRHSTPAFYRIKENRHE